MTRRPQAPPRQASLWATILDEEGFSARQIADVLGHTKVSMTQDVYLGRAAPDPATAEAMQRALA